MRNMNNKYIIKNYFLLSEENKKLFKRIEIYD